MPLLIAPFFAFGLGALLALAHRGAPGARGLARGRIVVALFAASTIWPPLAWAADRALAWSTLYMIDPRSFPASAALGATIVVALLAPAGYEVGVRVATSPARARLALAIVPLGFGAFLVATFHGAVGTMTSFSDRARGAAGQSLFDTAFGAALVAVDLLAAVGVGVAFRALSEPRSLDAPGDRGRERG
ncbi:MAG TPA: hypothetical protein VL400_03180 [Polyangiaceae bacterium]|nr:hypothetical protein [Polyangiaceae bacterium]